MQNPDNNLLPPPTSVPVETPSPDKALKHLFTNLRQDSRFIDDAAGILRKLQCIKEN